MVTLRRGATFAGANVFLSRSLVPPEVFDTLHDALKLNGATVFLCCDPSRTAANDYHVIASSNHEKFADLRAKGCNLLGPHCILSCAKEYRNLPKQGYTCCLAMDGVKILASGFDKDEKVQIEQLVTAMGGVLHTKASQDVSFVIVKNVLATYYKRKEDRLEERRQLESCLAAAKTQLSDKGYRNTPKREKKLPMKSRQWASNILKKPIVTLSWLTQCWSEHRVVPQESYRILPFTGLTICVTRIPGDERKEMEKLIIQNGGFYSADLTKKCTHLISDAPEGDKYVVAQRWGHIHIVTRRWADQSIARRACLDEALYPVQINYLTCSDVRSSQKEQRGQELSNATSKTVSPLFAADTGAGLSQSIACSISDTTKLNNEGIDAAAVQLQEKKKLDSSVAVDSESDDDDLYLSNCRIFLVGFKEEDLTKLVSMIRKGGGSRYMLISEKLSHIIIGEPSDNERKAVRRLAAFGGIYVVQPTWLEECNQMKKEVAVCTRHLASELVFAKEPSCNYFSESSSDCTKNAKNFAGTPFLPVVHVSEDKQSRAELFSEKQRRDVRVAIDVNGSEISGLSTKTEKTNSLRARNSLSLGEQKPKPYSGITPTQSRSSPNIFKGKIFCFSTSFPYDRRAEVIEWVLEGGGTMVDDQIKQKVNFIIERHGLLHIPVGVSQFTVVSTHWIRSCLEEACIQDVGSHIIFSPLRCHIPLAGFQSLRFCVSQYEEKERLLLRNLCYTLGAKFTEKLTKKVTHLLCKFANGPKYEAACKWGIEPITADWVKECVSQDMMVALDPFRPKPVSDQDREAGLCTVSQHPTQAVHMVNQISQVLNEPLESKMNTSGKIDLHEENIVTISGKRQRLSECDSNGTVSKKKKAHENLLGSAEAVPDVADAIEDLLAQSSKIQDMKSPPQSGCDQSILSSDHSITHQDNENSRPSFDISKHWKSKPVKEVTHSGSSYTKKSNGTYDSFSETQTESQVVVYEEDLSGRQKIIDRVRSQSMTLTPPDRSYQ